MGDRTRDVGFRRGYREYKGQGFGRENHLLCRAAKRYSERVDDWFKETETLFFEIAAAAREGVSLDEAIEVIRWYQYFICSKVMRAVRGSIEEKEERCDEFASDSDRQAKIALIAIDRSIAAWAVIQHYMTDCGQEVIDILAFLDGLRQAVEKTFSNARLFIRPGFNKIKKKKKKKKKKTPPPPPPPPKKLF